MDDSPPASDDAGGSPRAPSTEPVGEGTSSRRRSAAEEVNDDKFSISRRLGILLHVICAMLSQAMRSVHSEWHLSAALIPSTSGVRFPWRKCGGGQAGSPLGELYFVSIP